MGSEVVRILLVDDDEDDQFLTRAMLDEIGRGQYQVDAVSSFALGREAIRRLEHDAYLLDYHLGERTGLDLLREAMEAECAAPIILLTGVGDRDIDEEAVRAGAADYLVKGQITPALLERSIRYALERKRAEQERTAFLREQAARAEAEAAIRARDEFLWVVAHELKTPVTSLRAYAELLVRVLDDKGADTDPARVRRAAQTIAGQSDRLVRLVATLLDLARLQAGKLAPSPVPTNVVRLVEEAVEAAQATTSAHQLTLSSVPELRATLDPLLVQQVVTNLLDNAMKYSPAGGPITVALERLGPDTLRLVVRDHGVGIPPDKQQRIFERFYQAHDVSQHSGGLGLGLNISRQIVELHGGRIMVECPPDGGTAVFVELPTGANESQPDRALDGALDSSAHRAARA